VLWRILDGKIESDLMLDSELRCVGPCSCRLRINRLALVSKFDYVLMHIRFMGSRKLSSFDSRPSWTIPHLWCSDVYRDSVQVTHG
jgi:hypothetical protein